MRDIELHPYLEANEFEVSITANDQATPDLRDLAASIEAWSFSPNQGYDYDEDEDNTPFSEDDYEEFSDEKEGYSEEREDEDEEEEMPDSPDSPNYEPLGVLVLNHHVNRDVVHQINLLLDSVEPIIVTVTHKVDGKPVAKHTFVTSPQDLPQAMGGSRSSTGPLLNDMVLDVYQMDTWELA